MGKFLSDKKKNGKKRPWKEKKMNSIKVSKSFRRMDEWKRADRILDCGDYLEFVFLEDGSKKLKTARFCRERLCPMCGWRKSLKVAREVSRVMDAIEEGDERFAQLFLTLTVGNCDEADLPSLVEEIFKALNRLMGYKRVEKAAKGWFRSLEVTFNISNDTFHPHVHMILSVDKSYFDKNGDSYIKTAEWVKLWRRAMRLDYDPVCDVRRIKETSNGARKAVAEVAKYTVKDSDYVMTDEDLMDKVVFTLHAALRGRRLYAFGGAMKECAKFLGALNPDEGDLVRIDGAAIRDDVAETIVTYSWNYACMDYVRVERWGQGARPLQVAKKFLV
jgi:plasmid rolling circle replication initiator protein Rep